MDSPPKSSTPLRKSLAFREPTFSFNDSTYSLALSSLIDTLSISNCSATTSETVPGPGALSGKAIRALGKATLRGAEKLIIWRKAQAINAKFPHNNGDDFQGAESMYEDVLELSRRDMYPDVLRSRALRIILVQIGSRQTDLLIQTLTTWDLTEVEILISDLTEILNPLRLSTTREIGELSDQARAYQASLASWEIHTLGPVVLFFRQLARHSLIKSGTRISRIIMEGSAMDFVLHLYHSNFVDPLGDPGSAGRDGRQSFHKLCETLLIACSRADRGKYVDHHQRPFHLLWSMEQPYLSTELGNTLVERAEILTLMKPEYIVSLIRLIFHMMDDWDVSGERKSTAHERIATDLIELSGLTSRDPEINFLALRALQRFVSFRVLDTKDALRQYITSRDAEHLSGLMASIFKRISQLISMNTLDWDIFISRWYEPNCGPVDESVSRSSGMLEVINSFVEVAQDSPEFLNIVIEANMLGLLRPFLEMELRTNESRIAKHDGDMLMSYDESDMPVLALIGGSGLMRLFPSYISGHILEFTPLANSRTRAILARAFAVILQRLKEVSPTIF